MPKFFLTIDRRNKVNTSFKELALANKKVINLFNKRDEGAYAIDTRALIQELEDAHLARKYRTFKSNEFVANAQMKLMDWTAEVERNRSRAVAIKMECIKVHHLLDENLKSMKSYLLTQYREQLSEEHNTVKAKSDAVDSLLEPFNKLLKKLDTVLKLCEILISDLSANHFSKESMIKILELNYNSK